MIRYTFYDVNKLSILSWLKNILQADNTSTIIKLIYAGKYKLALIAVKL